MGNVVEEFLLKLTTQFDSAGIDKGTSVFGNFSTRLTIGFAAAMYALNDLQSKLGQLSDFVTTNTVKAFIELDDIMIAVRKTADLSSSDTSKLTDSFIALSNQTGAAATDLAKIAETAGQMGMRGKEILPFVEVVNKMNIALGFTAEQSAMAAAKISTMFNITKDIAGFTRIGDVMNYLSDRTAATASQILEFNLQFGAMARQFNITLEQSSALGALFGQLGMDASKASTELQSAIDFMTRPANIEKISKMFNLDLNMLKNLFSEDLMSGFELVLSHMSNIGRATDRNAVLLEIFGKVGKKAIAPLLQNWKLYKENLQFAAQAHGSMEKEFKVVMESMGRQWKILIANITNFGISIGKAMEKNVAPAFQYMASWMRSFNNSATEAGWIFGYLAKVTMELFVIATILAGFVFLARVVSAVCAAFAVMWFVIKLVIVLLILVVIGIGGIICIVGKLFFFLFSVGFALLISAMQFLGFMIFGIGQALIVTGAIAAKMFITFLVGISPLLGALGAVGLVALAIGGFFLAWSLASFISELPIVQEIFDWIYKALNFISGGKLTGGVQAELTAKAAAANLAARSRSNQLFEQAKVAKETSAFNGLMRSVTIGTPDVSKIVFDAKEEKVSMDKLKGTFLGDIQNWTGFDMTKIAEISEMIKDASGIADKEMKKQEQLQKMKIEPQAIGRTKAISGEGVYSYDSKSNEWIQTPGTGGMKEYGPKIRIEYDDPKLKAEREAAAKAREMKIQTEIVYNGVDPIIEVFRKSMIMHVEGLMESN